MAKLNHQDGQLFSLCHFPFVLGCWWALGQPFSLFLLRDFGAFLHIKLFASKAHCSLQTMQQICRRFQSFLLSFLLAIFTLPFQSVLHLFCHFFQSHLSNVSTSEICFASWLRPKYWAC